MQKLNIVSIDVILGTGSGPEDFIKEVLKMAGKEDEDEANFLEVELKALWHAAKAVEQRHNKEDVEALTRGLHVPPRSSRKRPLAQAAQGKKPFGLPRQAAPPHKAGSASATLKGMPSLRQRRPTSKRSGSKKIPAAAKATEGCGVSSIPATRAAVLWICRRNGMEAPSMDNETMKALEERVVEQRGKDHPL